ncbi:MAG TPA: hypothetical protein PL033_07590 [Candidatus Brocadiia bacterium]|nr:hypothetical protein [Candidatus Brocadiia bacterium]
MQSAQNILIPESQDGDPARLNLRLPNGILAFASGVRGSVHLDGEAKLHAVEVNDAPPDRILAAEARRRPGCA